MIHSLTLAFTAFVVVFAVRVASYHGNHTEYLRMRFDATKNTIQKFTFRDGVRPVTPTRNISFMLDSLLRGYDSKLRPAIGGPPAVVEIDVEVRSMGQISEMDMVT
ncbi:Neurotransmitter-gated ion-channel ligand-binding domain [Trinorchestia longiramus]|nr:Neurotransmitter-gated ion-channel ligand-binding domain [Trinorchestia longiramus]